jgi:hypothetical protein
MATRSVWMTEDDELLWDSIPRGHRSEIIKSALNDWKMKATSKDYNIELLTKLEHLQKRRFELEKEYSKAEMEFNEINDEIEFIQDRMRKSDPLFIGSTDNISSSEINPVEFFEGFIEQAKIYLSNGTIFTSPSGRNRYRIHGIDEEKTKVFVERMDSKSPKPSSFTYETVRKAVLKLQRVSDNTLKIGEFMPVLAQECAVVAIHPYLRREEDSIIYDREVS